MKLLRTLFGLIALVACGFAFAETPIVIKFSFVNPLTSPKGMAADYFKKLAEEGTGGRVKVELYPNSQLYRDKEEIEALQLGAVQMLAPTLGKFGPLGAREFELFDLPYLFENYDEVHRITEGAIGQQLMAKLEPKGLKGLAFWDNGFKQMSANKPLRTPDDFKGVKMRIFSSKVLESEMRALGALPQVIAASEIYTSLQTGLVDGSENTESTFFQFKFFEVQKYLTLTDHGYVGYGVIVNKKFWEGLPPDIRTTLESAMKEATKYANKITEKENREALDGIRTTGKTQIVTLSPDDKKALKKALMKAHEENAAKIGKELIQSVYRETGFDPGRL